MTKRRTALSFDDAATRIAAQIGWEEMAGIVGRSERAVRNWSDPECATYPSIDQALALDVAYRARGGEGAPYAEAYADRLEMAAQAAQSASALPRLAGIAAKETGEALAALIAAAQPGATLAERAIARREGREAIAALTKAEAALGLPPEQGD